MLSFCILCTGKQCLSLSNLNYNMNNRKMCLIVVNIPAADVILLIL